MLRAARAGGEPPRILQYNNETDEARETVADIRRRMETDQLQPRDFAILFRTNEQPRAFETELRKAKIPYVILGSQSFFDRKEVKDILAYLRTIDSPRDEVSLLRIINNPPRGIGQKTVETLLKEAVTRGDADLGGDGYAGAIAVLFVRKLWRRSPPMWQLCCRQCSRGRGEVCRARAALSRELRTTKSLVDVVSAADCRNWLRSRTQTALYRSQ